MRYGLSPLFVIPAYAGMTVFASNRWQHTVGRDAGLLGAEGFQLG
jgi:hypothetical protein